MPSWISVNGVSLRHELTGAGPRVLVLLNAMGATVESWDEFVPAFTPEWRILRYDMRGTGLSERVQGEYRFDQALGDFLGLLDAVVPGSDIVLIGAALGGAVALGAAAARPAAVRALVLLAPVTDVDPARRDGLRTRAAMIEREGLRRFIEEDILPGAYPAELRGNIPRFEQFRLRHRSNDPASYAATQRMVATIDLDASLRRVACPTLVLTGAYDVSRPPHATRKALEPIAGARFEVIHSGHFMATQSPELVIPPVARFLGEI